MTIDIKSVLFFQPQMAHKAKIYYRGLSYFTVDQTKPLIDCPHDKKHGTWNNQHGPNKFIRSETAAFKRIMPAILIKMVSFPLEKIND